MLFYVDVLCVLGTLGLLQQFGQLAHPQSSCYQGGWSFFCQHPAGLCLNSIGRRNQLSWRSSTIQQDAEDNLKKKFVHFGLACQNLSDTVIPSCSQLVELYAVDIRQNTQCELTTLSQSQVPKHLRQGRQGKFSAITVAQSQKRPPTATRLSHSGSWSF